MLPALPPLAGALPPQPPLCCARAPPPHCCALDVAAILVCTDPICEEEHGALDVLAALRVERLPAEVIETGCLGCCGCGAQVCVEYANGGASIVSGVAETLVELGLEASAPGDEASAEQCDVGQTASEGVADGG